MMILHEGYDNFLIDLCIDYRNPTMYIGSKSLSITAG